MDEDRKRKLPDQLIEIAKKEGKAVHEGWRVRKDGTKFWGTIVITALHGEHNEVIGFTKVTRDLTERKLAEDKLKKFAQDIENRNKQLEEYAFIASHDLQEPLRKIQIFSDLLERHLDDKRLAQKYIGKITSSSKRMVKLIKGVLQYSQVENIEELFKETDLNEILYNVREEYQLLIEQKKAQVIYSELPLITGIPIQMHQLFSNLMSNALKFSDKEPVIEITAEKYKTSKSEYAQLSDNKEYWKLVFKDNGVGFDTRYSHQVFKLFKRLDVNVSGIGIGLALCKRIIEKHKGHIDVATALNEGTTFTIFLPA